MRKYAELLVVESSLDSKLCSLRGPDSGFKNIRRAITDGGFEPGDRAHLIGDELLGIPIQLWGELKFPPEWEPEWETKYEESLEDHLKYFREAAGVLGVDEELIEAHDLSKRSPEEYGWYVRKFGGGQKGTIDDRGFGAAWLHHIHCNPHHWQHWIIPGSNELIKIPDKYVREMVADWMGSSKAYTGSFRMEEWLKQNLTKIMLHLDSAIALKGILVEELGYLIEYQATGLVIS